MKNDELDLIEGAAAAARILGLTKRQVYHMVSKNRLPHTRVGKRIYFRRSELERRFSTKQNEGQLNGSERLKNLIKEGMLQFHRS